MRARRHAGGGLALIGVLGLLGCGGAKPAPAGGGAAASTASTELTPFEIENGVGPITSAVTVGAIDPKLAEQGEKIFAANCTACHKLTERYVGPSLGGVTVRRTPTYVMNMILAPDQMYTRHPVAKELLGEFMTQMPNLSLTPDQARALVEYLRQHDAGGDKH